MKKLLKTAGAALLLAALLLPLAACGGGAATTTAPASSASGGDSAAASGGEFRVGMECAYAPFNWTQTDDSNGAVAIDGGIGYANGYDVQIARKIADSLGKKLVVVKTDWEGLPPALESGKIDAIIAGMSPTAERRQSIDFSDYYYDSDLVIVVKKDGPYAGAKTLNDFSGAKVTAQLNTFHYTVIDQIAGVKKQTAMEDFPTMIVALTSGKIDGYISERPGAMAAVASNPELTYVVPDPGFNYTKDDVAISVGLKKGSDLLDKVNEALSKISADDRQKLMEDAIANQPAES